jgi:hypothetical protein
VLVLVQCADVRVRREMAVKSAETVEWALRRAGVEDLKDLHVLEVGAGECGS